MDNDLVTIRNRRTGQTIQIPRSQLGSYGISSDSQDRQAFTTSRPSDTFSTALKQMAQAQPGQDESSQAPLGGIFRSGPLGWLTEQLPIAGSLAGMGVGGALGIEGGPLAVGTAVAGGAAGGGIGEAAREYLKGEKPSKEKISKEAIFGGVGAGVGEIARPVLGGAVRLAEKLPVVGALTQTVTKIGDRALEKLFGAGSADFARQYGLDKITSTMPADVEASVNRVRRGIGNQIGNLLDRATQEGKGLYFKDVESIIDSSLPKVRTATDKNIVSQMKSVLRNTLYGTTATEDLSAAQKAALKMATPDDYISNRIPISGDLVNQIKHEFGTYLRSADWQQQPPVARQAWKNAYMGIKNKLEDVTKGFGDIRKLNANYDKSRDVLDYIRGPLSRSTQQLGGGRSSLFSLLNPLNWQYLLPPVAREQLIAGTSRAVGKYGEPLAAQEIIRSGQPKLPQELGLHYAIKTMTPEQRDQEKELLKSSVAKTYPASMQANVEQTDNRGYTREWLDKAVRSDPKNINHYLSLYNTFNKPPTMSKYQQDQQTKGNILNMGIDLMYGDPGSQDYKTQMSIFKSVVNGLIAKRSGGGSGMYGAILKALPIGDKGIDYPSDSDSPEVQKQKLASILMGLQTIFNINVDIPETPNVNIDTNQLPQSPDQIQF